MSAIPSYKRLRAGHVIFLSFPQLSGAITGVARCTQDRAGRIELTYVDGSTESAGCSEAELAELDLYQATSLVQSKRAKQG